MIGTTIGLIIKKALDENIEVLEKDTQYDINLRVYRGDKEVFIRKITVD